VGLETAPYIKEKMELSKELEKVFSLFLGEK